MNTVKKRAVPWKEGKVISIRLKNGVYVLAQMLKAPDILFFNLFNDNDNWEGVALSNEKILFVRSVTRQFIKFSFITVIKNIQPLIGYKLPTKWIYAGFGSKSRIVTVSGKEENLILPGGYFHLVERDMENHLNNTHPSGMYRKELISNISSKDWEKLKNIEDMSLDVYPLLNERLYLCYQQKKNVNPYLDIRLGKELPDNYETYLKLLLGREPINELGY